MGSDFEAVAQALRYWLEAHNLPTDGVTLRVIFPRWRDVRTAEACLNAALAPHLHHAAADPLPGGVIARIAGIDVEFRVDGASERRRA